VTDVKTIRGRYEGLRQRYAERDSRMQQVAQVRAGDAISPGLFPAEWPKPIIANFIDTVARDLAEVLAPLPAVGWEAHSILQAWSANACNCLRVTLKSRHYLAVHVACYHDLLALAMVACEA